MIARERLAKVKMLQMVHSRISKLLSLSRKDSYFDNGGQCAEIQIIRYSYHVWARADEL